MESMAKKRLQLMLVIKGKMRYFVLVTLFCCSGVSVATTCVDSNARSHLEMSWTERSRSWPYETFEAKRKFALPRPNRKSCYLRQRLPDFWIPESRYLRFTVKSIPKRCLNYLGEKTPVGKAALEMCVYTSHSDLQLSGFVARRARSLEQ